MTTLISCRESEVTGVLECWMGSSPGPATVRSGQQRLHPVYPGVEDRHFPIEWKTNPLGTTAGSSVQPQPRREPHQGVVSLRDGIEWPAGLRNRRGAFYGSGDHHQLPLEPSREEPSRKSPGGRPSFLRDLRCCIMPPPLLRLGLHRSCDEAPQYAARNDSTHPCPC
jgi:hypothetical protein